MEEKSISYLNIGLAVVVAVSVVMLVKTCQRTITEPAVPAVVSAPAIPETVSAPAAPEASGAGVHRIQDIYRHHSAEDTGTNLPQAWMRVKTEDKAKVYEELDKKIGEARDALAVNPADKKAKHRLFIAETVKKLALNGFDYSQVPQPDGQEIAGERTE